MVKWTKKLVCNAQVTKLLFRGYFTNTRNFLKLSFFHGIFYYYYKYSNIECQNDAFKKVH
jgi:hypothetical protein